MPTSSTLPRLLVEEVDDILAWLDGDGRVLYVNRAVETVLAHPPGTLIDRPVWDLIHANDLTAAKDALLSAKKHPGRPTVLDCRVRHRQGGWRRLEVRGSSHRINHGVAVALVARDVTHIRRREQLLQQWIATISQRSVLAKDLLSRACDALMQAYDLTLAYTMRLRPGAIPLILAHAGAGIELLKDILAGERPDNVHFPGVDATAFGAGPPRLLSQAELDQMSWRDTCRHHQLEQVALLPYAGPDPGCFVLCACHHQAFSAAADLALLAEFAQLIGVALEAQATQRQLDLLSRALAAADDAVFITDRDGVILWVNAAFTRLTGYEAAEAVGATPRLLRSGLHDEAYYADLKGTIRRGKPWHGETTNRRRDGSLYTAEQTITPIVEGRRQVRHFVAIQRDVSERKRLETEVRNLAMAIDRARSEERDLMAREIHDELGGSLAAIKHDLEWLLARKQPTECRQRLKIMYDLTLKTLAAAKGMAERLPLTPVAELGLLQALYQQARAFGEHTGIGVTLDIAPDLEHLPAAVSAQIYRIMQECLTNVAKHAQASTVAIHARIEGRQVVLEVHDNGIGFAPETTLPGVALGIRGMAERAQLLGGYLEIDRLPEDGSRVRLVVPLPPTTRAD